MDPSSNVGRRVNWFSRHKGHGERGKTRAGDPQSAVCTPGIKHRKECIGPTSTSRNQIQIKKKQRDTQRRGGKARRVFGGQVDYQGKKGLVERQYCQRLPPGERDPSGDGKGLNSYKKRLTPRWGGWKVGPLGLGGCALGKGVKTCHRVRKIGKRLKKTKKKKPT